jgi:hypothetical protein
MYPMNFVGLWQEVRNLFEYLSLRRGAEWHRRKLDRMFLARRQWRLEAHKRGVRCPVKPLRGLLKSTGFYLERCMWRLRHLPRVRFQEGWIVLTLYQDETRNTG